MKASQFDINRLRIASPCSVAWENMTGNERVRRCDLCKLNVFNISALTPGEVESLIKSREGRLCIRMYKRADGTVLTKDCPVGLRALRKRVTSFAAAVFGAVLGLFTTVPAQHTDRTSTQTLTAWIVIIPDRQPVVTGTVVDSNGAVVPGARIRLTRESATMREATSDENGLYTFTGLEPGIYSLEAEAANFDLIRVKNLAVRSNQKLKLDIPLSPSTVTVFVGILLEEDSENAQLPFSFGGTSTTIRLND